MDDAQAAKLRELAERARKPQGWKRIAFQAARLDEFREAASPDVVIRLLDELDRLRHENHNLNWALGTDGYEQMYTEAERVEHADAVARITEHLDRLAARKARLDALVPAGVDILDHIDALRRERDEYRSRAASVDFWRGLHEDGWTAQRVADEMHDYLMLLRSVPKVYDHVTNGRVSKPSTPPEVVCALADEALHDSVTESVKQALADERVEETRAQRDAALALLTEAGMYVNPHILDDARAMALWERIDALLGGGETK